MANRRFWHALILAALAGGCVPSLNPLYTEKDLVFEPGLVGTWAGDKDTTWTFEKRGGKSYRLTYTEKGVPARFEAHLVRLGGSLFLDTYPDGSEMPRNNFYRAHFIPAHFISKVELAGNELNLVLLNPDWMNKGIREKKLSIRHEPLGKDRLLLTASTAELQTFVRKYANDPKAFQLNATDKLTRVKSAPTTQPQRVR